MNKMVATMALGCLTIGSLAVGLSSEVEAFVSRTVLPVENSSTFPKAVEAEGQNESVQQIAYQRICEVRWVNGRYVSCCVDSEGNWACVW